MTQKTRDRKNSADTLVLLVKHTHICVWTLTARLVRRRFYDSSCFYQTIFRLENREFPKSVLFRVCDQSVRQNKNVTCYVMRSALYKYRNCTGVSNRHSTVCRKLNVGNQSVNKYCTTKIKILRIEVLSSGFCAKRFIFLMYCPRVSRLEERE